MDRGRRRQDAKKERLERWQDDKGSESEIKKQEAGEAARGAGIRGGKVSLCACCFFRKMKTRILHLRTDDILDIHTVLRS